MSVAYNLVKMNKLSLDRKAQVIRVLCEGNSIRSTARITGSSINTVVKLLKAVGDACANRVEIITKSGKKFSELVQYHRGHCKTPFTDEEIEQKFHSLTRDLLPPAQREELFSLVWNLEQVEDVGKIMQSLII